MELRTELLELIAAGPGLDDETFHELALRVFAHAFDAVAAYGAFCRARGRTPDTVNGWTDIPAVPTAAFKEVALKDAPAERVFRTSGTTRGQGTRGEHHVVSLGLYRASLRTTFETFLLPDRDRPRMLSLMPPARDLPGSSLAFMISDAMDAFGGPGSRPFADAAGLDYESLEGAVDEAKHDGLPILLLGTSAAFIHWLDRLDARDRTLPLPEGSRLMDTGGYKGRGRQVAPGTLRAAYARRLGLPSRACVNEYGMTELLSQYYDAGLRDPGSRGKKGPGWLRTVAVNPETLEPLPDGETGLLRHVDLANLHSVPAIQTEDLGRVVDGEVFLDGRVVGAPPRGCSLAMDHFLEATA